MAKITLRVSELGSDSLREELLALFEARLPPPGAEDAPTEEQLTDMQALCAQAASLAKLHRAKGPADVELHVDDDGKPLAVVIGGQAASYGQNFDPVAKISFLAERAAAARAKAKLVTKAAPAPAAAPPVKAGALRSMMTAQTSAAQAPSPASAPTKPPAATSSETATSRSSLSSSRSEAASDAPSPATQTVKGEPPPPRQTRR